MREYNADDDELRREYKEYISHGGDDTTNRGHGLAGAAFQRAKERGISLEDWVKHSSRHNSHESLDDSADEKEIAKTICKEVALQKVPLRHSGILIENVMREHGYKHLHVKGKSIPLSKTRNFLVDYARNLFFKYNLPTEPLEHPEIVIK
ncbi:MAG: hypothetical protein AABY15_01105 [Nanoarchaeota archaeon]